LALPTGQLYAALADHGVVLLRHPFGELLHMRDAAGLQNVGILGIRAARTRRFRGSCRRTERCPVALRRAANGTNPDGCVEVGAIKVNRALGRFVESGINPMMVDFPDPEEPTSAVTVPGRDSKLISCSTALPA